MLCPVWPYSASAWEICSELMQFVPLAPRLEGQRGKGCLWSYRNSLGQLQVLWLHVGGLAGKYRGLVQKQQCVGLTLPMLAHRGLVSTARILHAGGRYQYLVSTMTGVKQKQ